MKIERLEHKLGIKASDTAAISFIDCRIPAANLLGHAEIDVAKSFAGVMETLIIPVHSLQRWQLVALKLL